MATAAVLDEHTHGILDAAKQEALTVRVLGGLAIWMRSPQTIRELLTREYADIDLVARQSEASSFRALLERLDYVPDREFNMYQGHKRLYYNSPDGAFHIDVFLDVFEMSHTIDLKERLTLDDVTLPASDLLVTKLQIAEINEKDVKDTAMLLLSHRCNSQDARETVNLERICTLCGMNWGLYTTVTDNLTRTKELVPELLEADRDRAVVADAIDAILSALVGAPKTRAWRLRARIGRRVRWYTLPDEVE